MRARETTRDAIGRDGASPRTIVASGCGEDARYACYTEGGWVSGLRSRRFVDAATVCVER
jgi:hypothetical protein